MIYLMNIALLSFGFLGTSLAKNPCKAEIKKLCSGFKKGKKRQCLMQHKNQLSAKCKKHIRKRSRKQVKNACSSDIETFCKDIEPGKNRIMRCLLDHKDQLTKECKTQAKKHKKRRKALRANKRGKKVRKACKADVEKYCPSAGKNKKK